MHSLESCPHIISNPINSTAYHPYATIASFSNESFSRQNISRNSSVITNLMDDLYINNEVGSIYAISPVNIPEADGRRHIFNEDPRHPSDLNTLNLVQTSLEQDMRSNEALSSINVNIHNGRERVIEENQMDIRNVRFQAFATRSAEVRVSIDTCEDDSNGRTSRQTIRGGNIDDENNDENNFGALADIRESRV